jgi:hypothetical protein
VKDDVARVQRRTKPDRSTGRIANKRRKEADNFNIPAENK